jgi:hypothetical protein
MPLPTSGETLMLPLLGGLLSGGIGAISSMFNTNQNNANSLQMQQQAEQFNQAQTLQQENFQKDMSSTAYQRASKDMTAAGLNPASMFGSGSAASSPAGGSSTIQPAVKTSAAGGIGDALKSIVPTAVQLKTADATIDNLVQQNANLKTEQINKSVDTGLKAQQAGLAESSTRRNLAETSNIRASLPTIADTATSARNRLAIDPDVRKMADQIGYYGNVASKAVAPVANLVSSARGIKSLAPQRSTTETTRDDGSSSFSERYQY